MSTTEPITLENIPIGSEIHDTSSKLDSIDNYNSIAGIWILVDRTTNYLGEKVAVLLEAYSTAYEPFSVRERADNSPNELGVSTHTKSMVYYIVCEL